MKALILAMLKTSFSKKGLSDKTINALVEQILSGLEANATETDIQSAIDAVEPFATLMQSEADAARTAARKEAKTDTKGGDKKENGGNSEPEKSNNEDVPEYVKALMKKLENVEGQFAAMKQGESTKTRRQVYERELDGLPEGLKKTYLEDFDLLGFKDDDHFNTWIEGKKTGLTEIRESNIVNAASNFGNTQRATGGATKDKPSANFQSFQAGRDAKSKDVVAKDAFN